MNLKKIKLIQVIGVFLISILFHFVYKWFPNTLFALFFPVNESIWEHMKILFSATLTWGIFDSYLLRKNSINSNNFMFQLFFSAFISIPIYLIIYLPLRNAFGESMFFSLSLMIIVYAISSFISYKLLRTKNFKFLNRISISLIIFVYIIFTYLTYKPIHNYIFYDKSEMKYGINDYIK